MKLQKKTQELHLRQNRPQLEILNVTFYEGKVRQTQEMCLFGMLTKKKPLPKEDGSTAWIYIVGSRQTIKLWN